MNAESFSVVFVAEPACVADHLSVNMSPCNHSMLQIFVNESGIVDMNPCG